MAVSSILTEINTLLDDKSPKSCELTFALLDIDTYHNGTFLKRVQRPYPKIIIHKPVNSTSAQMEVQNNLVFSFSFWFEKPTCHFNYKSKMLQLPRPLTEGALEMDAEKLVLRFTIDAPDKVLQVRIQHTYTQLL
ncbi:hypothetical protein FVB32_16370 [Flagellimonas hymeniacidonis]|uniref:Uncharacterized protein n=1 Tax=Flagellimonas hymeniacidonis TaxID=2603628 RepID=A0A5C8V531_9FLAO|nr:hypothetical protein [Flagellimonas hymeniacidonis]TXN36132.1 hypothetical protein FVB32_16370 [Flagellimonas hymeniacidonis]